MSEKRCYTVQELQEIEKGIPVDPVGWRKVSHL